MPTPLTAADMHLYRHPEIQTSRPFALDIDDQGVLWQGNSGELFWHDTRTARCGKLRLHALAQMPVISVFSFQKHLVVFHANHPYITIHNPADESTRVVRLPGEAPIVWYGVKAAGKLLLFDRAKGGGVLVLDSPDATPRKCINPFGDYELAGGSVLEDGRVLIIKSDEMKFLFFDPVAEKFTRQVDTPYTEVGISGRFDHAGVLYMSDSVAGRLLAYDLRAEKWLEPIPTPDHLKIYGFVGGSVALDGIGYFCLSSYRFRSRLDRATGQVITPPNADIGCDGKPHRFLGRYLSFDPSTRKFAYLEVPAQPDGEPLICYAHADARGLVISGYIIPYGKPGEASKLPGDWLLWQSNPAKVEPFRADAPVKFDKTAHVRDSARRMGTERSLYVAAEPHCPPPVNMEGPSFGGQPGRQQALDRRMAVTDVKKYWEHLGQVLHLAGHDDASRVAAVGAFVQRNTYYNPVHEPEGSPLLMLESGDVRCGQSVAIARAILDAMGIRNRARGLPNHVVAEAFYDNDWHLLDSLIFGEHQPAKDGKVLSLDELAADKYFADAMPMRCFDYDPDELRSREGFYWLGYVFGEWGSLPFYSGYFGPMGEWEFPPTLPLTLPGQRLSDKVVRLRWAPSIRRAGGKIEYRVQVYSDRAMRTLVHEAMAPEAHLDFDVPQANCMYHYRVSAVDDHRQKNPRTWYPSRVSNFMLVPTTQYGWYGTI
ncbi:MAG: hypothetical protein NTW19_09355 [Planctomycetota bacterium]|nr:hypothetical protein [Planctomycetota bacterium]